MNCSNSNLLKFLSYISVSFSFLLPLGSVLYIFSIFSKIKAVHWFLLLAFQSVALILLVFYDFVALYTFLFYFGFICLFFLFKGCDDDFFLLLLKIFIVVSIFECLLINSVLPPQLSPFYPDLSAHSHFSGEGNYNRPYSFGRNASVSSVVLVVLYSYYFKVLEVRWHFLSLLSLFLFASGSGFIAFLLMVFWYFRNNILIILMSIFIMSIFVYSEVFYKISYSYLLILFDFKISQISNLGDFNYFWGANSKDMIVGSDNGWLYLFYNYGMIGLFLVVSFSLFNINTNNALQVLIFLITYNHYPVFSFFFGTVIFSFVLSRNSSLASNYLYKL